MKCGGTIRLNPVGMTVLVVGCLLLYLYSHYGGGKQPHQPRTVEDAGATLKQAAAAGGKVKLRRLLVASIDAAQRGGKEVLAAHAEGAPGIKVKGKTKEGVDEPLTPADLRSHQVMSRGLKKAFPGVALISEEEDPAGEDGEPAPTLVVDDSSSLLDGVDTSPVPQAEILVPVEDVAIWIDPLDATKEYTENLLQYVTTMVCVSVKGKPTIGVVHFPFGEAKRTVWAWVGHGNNVNAPAKSSNDDQKGGLKVVVSRSHKGPVQDVASSAFGESVVVVDAAGSGYKCVEVAEGRADAYLHATAIKKWDVCAGDAILSSMGGRLTTLRGELLDYSPGADPLNTDGLLAALTKQQQYLAQLQANNPDKKKESAVAE